MKYFLVLFVILAALPGYTAWETGTVAQEKKQAVERLLDRKVDFEKYQKRLEEWNKKRLARAHEMKRIRARHAAAKEKARKKFVRRTEEFPESAYRKFLADREERRKDLKKARKGYAKMQSELKKVFENKKYRIDGKKEFKL